MDPVRLRLLLKLLCVLLPGETEFSKSLQLVKPEPRQSLSLRGSRVCIQYLVLLAGLLNRAAKFQAKTGQYRLKFIPIRKAVNETIASAPEDRSTISVDVSTQCSPFSGYRCATNAKNQSESSYRGPKIAPHVPPDVRALSRTKQRQLLALRRKRSPPDCTMDRLESAAWCQLQCLVRRNFRELEILPADEDMICNH